MNTLFPRDASHISHHEDIPDQHNSECYEEAKKEIVNKS